MKNTYKTLLLGSAIVLTLGAPAAMAEMGGQKGEYTPEERVEMKDTMGTNNDAVQMNAETDADGMVEVETESTAEIGGQQGEYAPEERNERADTLGTNNDGVQMNAEMDDDVVIDAEQIAAAQEQLNDEGYTVAVDGTMGEATREALMAFQSSNNLSTTGELDAQTMAALNISND